MRANATKPSFCLDEDDHDGKLRVEHARPFDMLLDHGIHADAPPGLAAEPSQHTRPKSRRMMDQAKV